MSDTAGPDCPYETGRNKVRYDKVCDRCCPFLATVVSPAVAQTYDTVRVATYNILDYPSNSTTRNPEYRKILHNINPDIIVVQEITDTTSAVSFLNNVLNYGQAGTYTGAPCLDGPDTHNAMYYKSARFSFIGPQTVLHTALRDINGYRLRPAGIFADTIDIRIFSCHLKASQGYETQRGAEAETLRTYLNSQPAGFFIVAGDMNLYTNTEAAYVNFTGSRSNNIGRVYDPINRSGSWHDNASYEDVHTQSTQDGEGGMDDRFDFLLLSYYYQNTGGWDYLTGSYTAYGNDGNHLNQAINVLPNTAVPDSIANALEAASDHCPVYLKLIRQLPNPASITVASPNGAENWYWGESHNITWSSQLLTGNVTIKLNRTYPGGAWETLFAGTANDGTQPWTVTGPVSTNARVQIVSDNQPTVNDVSNGDFWILSPSITVQSPNGGEVWTEGQSATIFWASNALTGNVKLELNRSYPSASWETLVANTENDGTENWIVTAGVSAHARVRITSINLPSVGDTSDADFTIVHSPPPIILHDRHGDAAPGTVTFTANITDDQPGMTAKLLYRNATAPQFDSLTMAATGHPNKFSAAPVLTFGRWVYFLRATGADGQSTATDTAQIVLGPTCGRQISYDDGTAELFNWSDPDSFVWAVRFTPLQTPFVLCAAQVSVAAFHPDTAHTPIRLRIYSANGPSGMPGTLLREIVRGSVGNVIGGLPAPGAYAANIILCDDSTSPLELGGDFYVGVMNLALGSEAFAIDTSSTLAGRSVVYVPCDSTWHPEDGSSADARRGNRMIRVRGWTDMPAQTVIWISGNDVHLNWSTTGASYYKVYSTADPQTGNYQFVTSATDTSATLVGAIPSQDKLFYIVRSSSIP